MRGTLGGERRREKSLRIGVHHADGVVWGPVYRTHLTLRRGARGVAGALASSRGEPRVRARSLGQPPLPFPRFRALKSVVRERSERDGGVADGCGRPQPLAHRGREAPLVVFGAAAALAVRVRDGRRFLCLLYTSPSPRDA